MKTLVLLATTLVFCTMQTMGEIVGAFQEVLENNESFFLEDEKPKKQNQRGAQKWTGHFMVYGKEYPMTLKAVLDKERGKIEGEGEAGDGMTEDWSFHVAGTIESGGKVTFYTVSEQEQTYTFKGLYKDGKIKGRYSGPRYSGALQMKQTGSTWEGTYNGGPGTPTSHYKMEDVDLNLKDGMIRGTGKDEVGKFTFTGKMDSNNHVELLFHYVQDPTNPWTVKGKYNKKENTFKGNFLVKNFHGTFELIGD